MGQDDNDHLRKAWQQYWHDRAAEHAAWQARSDALWNAWRDNPLSRPPVTPPPAHVPLPAELHTLTCGARTRSGTPCKRRDLYRSGRCTLHGGLSTGPVTAEGKANSSRNAGKRTP